MQAQLIRRGAAGIALALLGLIGPATKAYAGGSGGAWTDPGDGKIGAGAGEQGSTPGRGGHGGGGSQCTYHVLPPDQAAVADNMAAQRIGLTVLQGPGHWYRKLCANVATIVWVRDPTAVSPSVVARHAFDATDIPLPHVHLNPRADEEQVVNLKTWMWVDNWGPVRASASAGAVTVTVTALPKQSEWFMGDGGHVSCAGPGAPYDAARSPESQHTDCGYTYRRSSARSPSGTFDLSVTTSWRVTWKATGIAGAGSFGTIARSTTVPVRVAEIQAVND